jgi:hypothetical protein
LNSVQASDCLICEDIIEVKEKTEDNRTRQQKRIKIEEEEGNVFYTDIESRHFSNHTAMLNEKSVKVSGRGNQFVNRV